MAKVIERFGTTVDERGGINHDDRPSSIEAAEAIVGTRLDRRKSYAIINGEVHESCEWTQPCTGCYEGPHTNDARGSGCHECGYRGRVRNGSWVPIIT
jgi:hypothetical protein